MNDLTKGASKSALKKRGSTDHINQPAQKKVAIDPKATLVQHRLLTSFDEARLESHQQTYKETCAEIESTCDHDMKQDANLETLIDSEFSNQFDTHDVGHSGDTFTAESNIALNDVEMSDSQSEGSVESFEEYAPGYPDDVNTPIMPARPAKIDISDFCLALGMWCDKEGVKRRAYAGLLQVLKLLNVPEIDKLPNRLSTLQSWSRRQLPLPAIHSAKIPVQSNKQPTGLTKPTEGKVHFLDARVMINMILCSSIQMDFHTGMADIVDSPHEFWHSNSWGSSIRTCGNDFVKYRDESPIIPSDIVEYSCEEDLCGLSHAFHCGQVVFFGRDKRQQSQTQGKVILKIRTLIANDERTPDVPSSFTIADNEYLLIEDFVREISPKNVVSRRLDIAFPRNQDQETRFLINHILNVSRRSLRKSNLAAPVRGELELKAFGREWLISNLNHKVLSFPLVVFIDEFGLYRNVYHSVSGIYAMPAALCGLERQKSKNAFTLALGPHGAELKDVLGCLQTGLKNIDRGCFLTINGEQTFVWAPVVAFLGDMKQQQASAGFLSPRATFSCRFCDTGFQDRGNLRRDIVSHGRYHHDVLALRQQSLTINGKTKRIAFLSKHGLKPQSSPLQNLTPALDLIMGCPPDPAHSEYYGLVRKVYPLLYTKILTTRAATEFTTLFHDFPFPSGWARIQSPAVHMGSWSMSECGRASIVIPIMLRCWLRGHHLRGTFKDRLNATFLDLRQRFSSEEDITVFAFAKLAKSNALISSLHLSTQDREEFNNQILDARQLFLGLMNAAQNSKSTSRKRKTINRHVEIFSHSRQSSVSTTSVNSLSDDFAVGDQASQSSQLEPSYASTLDDVQNDEAEKLPNFHIGMHFESIMHEYGVLWNVNVLFGEDKHRFFKKAVLSSNHRKPVRQVLLKDQLMHTIKCLLNGSFLQTDLKISNQIGRLRALCPALLKSLVSSDEDVLNDDLLEVDSHFLLETSRHFKPTVRNKLKSAYIMSQNLPVKITKSTCPNFIALLKNGLAEYDLHGLMWGDKFLHWYEQCSFTDKETNRRHSVRVGDFLELQGGEFCKLRCIFTHCMQYEQVRRVYFWVQILDKLFEKDEVLDFNLFRLTETDRIISLSSLKIEKPYMIDLDSRRKVPAITCNRHYLHCTWNINFL